MSIIKKMEEIVKDNLENGIIMKDFQLNASDLNDYLDELKYNKINPKIQITSNKINGIHIGGFGDIKIILNPMFGSVHDYKGEK